MTPRPHRGGACASATWDGWAERRPSTGDEQADVVPGTDNTRCTRAVSAASGMVDREAEPGEDGDGERREEGHRNLRGGVWGRASGREGRRDGGTAHSPDATPPIRL